MSQNKIYIRRLEEEDLAKKIEWINNNQINETLMYDCPLSLSETKEWYKKTLFDRNRWDFSIIEKKKNELVGIAGLIKLNYKHRNAQFYITLGEKSEWGKGYAKEALEKVLRFAFLELGLEKVYLYTLSNNEKARKLFEKTGFKQEALMKKHYFIHGKYHDLYQHAIMMHEFIEKYGEKR